MDKANMNEKELEMMTQAEYYKSIFDDQIGFAVDEKTIEIAIEMLRDGDPVDRVSRITNLPLVTVEDLQRSALVNA